MLNVHDLERRWLKYKIRSYAPYIIVSTFVIIGSISTLIYYPFNPEAIKAEKVLVVASAPKVESLPIQNNNPQVQETELEIFIPQNTRYRQEEKTLVLKPSLHFMDNIEESLDPYLSEQEEEPLEYTQRQEYSNKTLEGNPQAVIETVAPLQTKKRLIITTQKSESDLKDVIRRFKRNKNPALSLFIAKRYYQLKQYQKSYNYALMTNEIDKDIDESWILFSKSLVKLGQHELAIVTLKSYLKTNKSTQASILLRKIEGGSFR